MNKIITCGVFTGKLTVSDTAYNIFFGSVKLPIGCYQNGKFIFFSSVKSQYFTISELSQLQNICALALMELSKLKL